MKDSIEEGDIVEVKLRDSPIRTITGEVTRIISEDDMDILTIEPEGGQMMTTRIYKNRDGSAWAAIFTIGTRGRVDAVRLV